MAKLLKILLGLVLLAGAATGVYAFSRGGKKADGGMKLVDAQIGVDHREGDRGRADPAPPEVLGQIQDLGHRAASAASRSATR